ncbi:hypothetical protein NEOLI_004162 [Neolecta irregularis DAH-3]|uniref:Uncharacterized protein n=1 Tax=Neolecta irregularis (strain DAH-3) TaxID=1198029 RepID=A0A1U7LP22_NEOID|nr:hypothetical protein NEOLI_004162 [Neolecta irregularis DAH-3]|eukprot:OLL24378.1 hypothetical protein NEOLI_004162 [Neolecta irregularis DAH-3]
MKPLQTLHLYRHLQTQQIIVSLRLPLPSPRPSAGTPLRKDHWLPLVHARFSSPDPARAVYDILALYRARRSKSLKTLPHCSIPHTVADLADALHIVTAPVDLLWASPDDKLYARSWPKNARHLPRTLALTRGFRLV